MTCRDAIEVLNDFLSGELTPERGADVERHLNACVDCTNYLASHQHTQGLAREAFDEPPADMPDALTKAILAARRPD
ncbi:MAG: zf-HC2 domain-containing protein [Vicinamibacterales bacterium]